MAVKTPAPPRFSVGFNLQDALLGAVAGGTYDNVRIANGAQQFQLTRFGGSGSENAISVKPGGAVQVTPIDANAGQITIGNSAKGDSKISITSKSALQTFGTLPTGEKIAIVGGVAGVIIVGAVIFALKRK